MLKTFIATLLALFTAIAFAAVDINKATQADLEAVKGIGPAVASKILAERQKGAFKDWADVMHRVSGIKEPKAAKLSEAGLTVNGESFKAGSIKKDEKKAHRKEDKKEDKQAKK